MTPHHIVSFTTPDAAPNNAMRRSALIADVRHPRAIVHAFGHRLPFVLTALMILAACSAANPLAISFAGRANATEEVSRGVVNGLWEYDPDKNLTRLTTLFARAGEPLATQLSNRYLVRVGINRSYFMGTFLEVVALPEGWTYSTSEVINDGRTINIGDVVDVRGHIGTNLESVIAIVRKCDAQPVPDENKDWSIGCKRIDAFDSRGYGGKTYYLSVF